MNTANSASRRVAILQHRLLQYRTAFFERLRSACELRGVQLHLVHGQPSPAEASRKDTGSLPWADEVENRFLRVGGKDLVWQPLPAALRDADLVVLMQENRILSNYPKLFRCGVPPGQRIAYWGHGRNFQSDAPQGLRERWKNWLRNRVDWWFAYTELSARIVAEGGYPAERITVLDNAIDNDGFKADLAAVDDERLGALRGRIGAAADAPVGLYCGSLYPDKRLDLLVAAGDLIRRNLPAFQLVVVGDGPSREFLTGAAASRPWLHWVGMQRGVDKAAWFRLADCYLSPGAVGLHVLDAFCAGLPMITTGSALHGPEIAYLDSGRNGFVVEANAEVFARTCVDLLSDPLRRDAVRQAAAADAQRYTLDAMVENFVSGIETCLKSPRVGMTQEKAK